VVLFIQKLLCNIEALKVTKVFKITKTKIDKSLKKTIKK